MGWFFVFFLVPLGTIVGIEWLAIVSANRVLGEYWLLISSDVQLSLRPAAARAFLEGEQYKWITQAAEGFFVISEGVIVKVSQRELIRTLRKTGIEMAKKGMKHHALVALVTDTVIGPRLKSLYEQIRAGQLTPKGSPLPLGTLKSDPAVNAAAMIALSS